VCVACDYPQFPEWVFREPVIFRCGCLSLFRDKPYVYREYSLISWVSDLNRAYVGTGKHSDDLYSKSNAIFNCNAIITFGALLR